MKWLAVEPVPIPMMVPGSTYSSAASATIFFISSCVIFLLRNY